MISGEFVVMGGGVGSEARPRMSAWMVGKRMMPAMRTTRTRRMGKTSQSDCWPLRFFIGSNLNMAEMRFGVKMVW